MYRMPSSAVFRSVVSGKTLAYFCPFPLNDGEVLFSPDGESYWPVEHRGINGTDMEHEIRATLATYDQSECLLRRRGNVVVCGSEQYVLQEGVAVDMTNFVGMPRRRQPVYLLRRPNGQFVFVSVEASSRDDRNETYRLFVGSGQNMRRVAIQPEDVTSTPDGKLVILTAEKTFLGIPRAAVQPGTPLVPGWGSELLEHVDQTYYIISETLGGDVTIRRL